MCQKNKISHLFLVTLISLLIFSSHQKLYQVLSIFRHGARYPTQPYYDFNDNFLFKGQLTSVGMRQHQNLGKALRRQYIDQLHFLDPIYNKHQIEVYTTPYNRTIQSALSQLYGLYPPGNGPKLDYVERKYHIPPFTNNSDIQQQNFALPYGFQPISIKFNGKLIIQDCDEYYNIIDRVTRLKLSQYSEMNLTYSPFMDKMCQIFKIQRSAMNLSHLADLHSCVMCHIYQGKPLISSLSQKDLINMRHLTDWVFMFQHTLDLMKLQNSRKYLKIMETFDQRVSHVLNKSQNNYLLKWIFLSGHDVDIAPLLTGLNFSSSKCIQELYRQGKTNALNCQKSPDFATSMIFELHSDKQSPKQNDFYVMARYNGKYMNLCEKKDTKCCYSEFKNRIKPQIISDSQIDKLCGNKVPEIYIVNE